MKRFFKIACAALALGLATQASAQTHIVFTGSTAFRGATHTAIQNILTGTKTIVHSHATTLNSADFATFKGTYAGNTTYIYCSWSGSATGIGVLANTTAVSVISQAKLDAVTQGTTTANITLANNASDYETRLPTMAFSDVYKASTPYASATLTDSRPAVIPFRFVRNRGSNAAITNMTAQQVRALYNGSDVPLRLWTGNPADTESVIGVGRDNGSGTRITILAETKYGIGNPVQQWKMVTSTGSPAVPPTVGGTVDTLRFWPVNDGVGSAIAGNGGYSSGSNIATIMGLTSANVTTYDADNNEIAAGIPVNIIGYLGIGDSTTAATNGATILPYDGVTYSSTAVYEGNYTLWGYLHIYYTSLGTTENNFRLAINTQLDNTAVLGSNGLRVSPTIMHCARTSDGGIVSP